MTVLWMAAMIRITMAYRQLVFARAGDFQMQAYLHNNSDRRATGSLRLARPIGLKLKLINDLIFNRRNAKNDKKWLSL